MAKLNLKLSLESEIKTAIASQVLKNQAYKCAKCKVKHRSTALKKPNGEYTELDEFEIKQFVALNQPLTKIFLRVLPKVHSGNSIDPNDFIALCPKHAQAHLKPYIKEIKTKKKSVHYDPRMIDIQEIRNYVFACTGRMMTISDVTHLIIRVEKINNK